jgi:hypothetical protein
MRAPLVICFSFNGITNRKKLFISFFWINIIIYPETTSIFCATKNRNWEWLKNNNKIAEINDEWITFKKPTTSNLYFHLQYFRINEGRDMLEKLQKKCANDFAQPADNRLLTWTLMGINNQNVARGTFEIAN